MILDLLKSSLHPKELSAMFRMKYSASGQVKVKEPLGDLAAELNDREFCYAALHKVSRSFATVIQQLPDELRDPVCIFYLVLRGLDSIEDDSALPKQQKLALLFSFYKKNQDPDFRLKGIGHAGDYRVLLENYDKVSRAFLVLNPQYRLIISEVCKKMGEGMAYFTEMPVDSVKDYDLYCHYVAGLVGIGLSDLFAASGIESAELKHQEQLSNSMGLFLQKTNIIRDYLEDMNAGRCFWPKEIWQAYASDLKDFHSKPQSRTFVACLNHLVWDALQHVPDCLAYMEKIKNPKVFRFCAIPQVMAVATLSKIYNNPDVFTSVVKIRKGLTARLMLKVNDFQSFRSHVNFFTQEMFARLDAGEPNYDRLASRLIRILQITNGNYLPSAGNGKMSLANA